MTQKLILPLLLLGLLGLGAFLWIGTGGEGVPKQAGLEATNTPVEVPEPGVAALAEPNRVVRSAKPGTGSIVTTVVIPLVIELELESARSALNDPSAPAKDSAASAHIRGSMHGADSRGLAGYAEFVAGPNRGRILETDGEGRFGANDLYAGLSLVALHAPGTPGCKREVLLREGKDTQLNVGFGRPAQVRGLVKDEANNPLALATVEMDGQQTKTDEHGNFYFPRMTSGKVPVYVSKAGFATHREMQYITAGMNIPPGKLRFVLRKGATLTVTVPERIGGPGPGMLFLSGPLDGTASRKFPWHTKSPIFLHGGESIEIEDLPAGRIRLQYFRTGAQTLPKVISETLVAGVKKIVTFHLKPAPTLVGRVLQNGAPVDGALVRFEMPDVTGASVKALGGSYGRVQVEMGVLSQMPPAMQKAVTGGNGSFTFSAAESYSKVRYLTATSADGKSSGGRVVKPGELRVDIEISEALAGSAGLVIETSTRFQALPVRTIINGEPRSSILPAGERLTIADLPEGDWRVTAKWQSETILDSVPMTLLELEDLFLPIPEGAINGQSRALRDALQ